MKAMKNIKIILAALVCAMTVVSFSSCSNENSNSDSTAKTETTVAVTETATNPTFNNIKEYIAHPDVQKQIEKSKEQFSSLYDLDVYAEGDDVIVYEYKMLDQIPDDTLDAVKSGLNKQAKSQGSSLKPLYDELKSCVKTANPKIKLKYINKDGKEIFEYTFDSSDMNTAETTKSVS